MSFDNTTCPSESKAVDVSDSCSLPKSTRIAVYAALVYTTVIIHFVRGVALYMVCINASKVLHNRMFSNILHTPVLFFDTNTSGKFFFHLFCADDCRRKIVKCTYFSDFNLVFIRFYPLWWSIFQVLKNFFFDIKIYGILFISYLFLMQYHWFRSHSEQIF